MFRKSYFSFIFVAILLVVGHTAVLAQFAPVTGTVELKKADGTREPVAGAVIDVYRMDIKAGSPSGKSGKKGEFAFAGLQLGGTFILAISAPNCAPTVFPNVRAGQEKLVITLSPGDGSKYTEAEVRKGVTPQAGAGTAEAQAEQTAEQKKAQAEFEKKNAEITSKNEKIKQASEIVARTLKEGNDAYTTKNYDLAIAKYSEGLDAESNFVGSAPVLLNNRGAAYNGRAVDTFNKSIKLTDVSAKVAGLLAARKDFTDASASFSRSWEIMKNAPATDIADPSAHSANKLVALRGIKETFRLAVLTEQVDPTLIEAAKIMIPEYMNVETEAAKKTEASLIFADLYRVAGDMDNAILAYKALLSTSPDNIDALAGVGLSLVNNGYIKTDKTLLQEGSNYLQKFISVAPDTNKYKKDASDLIETLKKEQNVAPQKLPTGKKKP